jgi:hypothetical protein
MNRKTVASLLLTAGLAGSFLGGGFPGLALKAEAVPLTFAQETWIPEYNHNKHAQVAPSVQNSPYPISQNELDKAIREAARMAGIDVYVVVTEKGKEQAPAGQKFAVWKLRQMIAQWKAKGFKTDGRQLLLVVVRSDQNPAALSVDATAGTELRNRYGLEEQIFAQNGFLSKSFRPSNNPGDTAGKVVDFVTLVSQHVADVDARQGAPSNYFFFGILFIGGAAVAIFIGVRASRAGAVAKWQSRVGEVFNAYLELDGQKAFLPGGTEAKLNELFAALEPLNTLSGELQNCGGTNKYLAPVIAPFIAYDKLAQPLPNGTLPASAIDSLEQQVLAIKALPPAQ